MNTAYHLSCIRDLFWWNDTACKMIGFPCTLVLIWFVTWAATTLSTSLKMTHKISYFGKTIKLTIRQKGLLITSSNIVYLTGGTISSKTLYSIELFSF